MIKAVDNEGYTAEKTLTVTYNPVAEEARVRVIVSGEVLGLGTMIDETITAKSDQTVAQIVEDRLAAHGYSTIHDGVADADSYFLRHVMKTGITDGWSISAEERSLLEMLGYDIAEVHEESEQSGRTRLYRWFRLDGDAESLLYCADHGNTANP